MTDASGQPLQWNAEADRLLGMEGFAPAKGGAAWLERGGVFGPDGTTPLLHLERPIAKALAGESVDGQEIVLGTRRVAVSARPLRRAGGEALGAVAVFRELTAKVVDVS